MKHEFISNKANGFSRRQIELGSNSMLDFAANVLGDPHARNGVSMLLSGRSSINSGGPSIIKEL